MQKHFSKYYSLIDTESHWMCKIVSPFSVLKELQATEFEKVVNPQLLFEKLKRHRLFPMFYFKWKAWENKPPDSQWQQFEISLKKIVERNQLSMMQKTAELVRIVNAFKKQDIPVISVKGPALAQQLYGNIALKASIDLDILIDKNDFERASECLYTMGYLCPEMIKSFTTKQKKYLIQNFHHLGFENKQEHINVELHWMLNTNKYLLEYPFEMLFTNSVNYEIQGSEIRVLQPLHQAVHLMVHGAYHQWARLDWLLDWVTLIEQNKNNESFNKEVTKNGLERIVQQAFALRDLYFKEERKTFDKANNLVKRALNAANKEYNKLLSMKFKQKLYLIKLKAGFKYKFQVFSVLGTNKGDWELIKLPDSLFFMYYILRPALFLINKFRSKI